MAKSTKKSGLKDTVKADQVKSVPKKVKKKTVKKITAAAYRVELKVKLFVDCRAKTQDEAIELAWNEVNGQLDEEMGARLVKSASRLVPQV